MLPAHSPSVIATLEHLLAPGGRAHISPAIERAQCALLLGEDVDPITHTQALAAAVDQHNVRIAELAADWVAFDQDKQFRPEIYEGRFLDVYLAYYLPSNVARLQHTLIDVVRAGALPESLRVLDVGVGTGTSLLAVTEFLIAWWRACAIHGAAFPVAEVTFTGIDCNEEGLRYAERVAQVYADVLLEVASCLPEGDARSMRTAAASWVRAARWTRHDLCADGAWESDANLIVASYVLNELDAVGQQALAETIDHLRPGGVAVVIEPGDETPAQRLMRWRRNLITASPHLKTIGPCGQEFGRRLPAVCERCWNFRRESFYQPHLYRAFRGHVAALNPCDDDRPFHNYWNSLLPWSYVLIASGTERIRRLPPAALTDHEPFQQRMFTYLRTQELRDGRRWLHLCHGAVTDADELLITSTDLASLPRLRYGSLLRVSGRLSRWRPGKYWLNPDPGTLTLVAPPTPAYTDSGTTASQGRLAALEDLAVEQFGHLDSPECQHLTLQWLAAEPSSGSEPAVIRSASLALASKALPGSLIVFTDRQSPLMAEIRQLAADHGNLADRVLVLWEPIPEEERERRLTYLAEGAHLIICLAPEDLDALDIVRSLQGLQAGQGVHAIAVDVDGAADHCELIARVERVTGISARVEGGACRLVHVEADPALVGMRALAAARCCTDPATAAAHYARTTRLPWELVAAEIPALARGQRAVWALTLLRAWVGDDPAGRGAVVALHLADTPTMWRGWSGEELCLLAELVAGWATGEQLITLLLAEQRDPARVLVLAERLLVAGLLPGPSVALVVEAMARTGGGTAVLDLLEADGSLTAPLYRALADVFPPTTWPEMEAWLACFASTFTPLPRCELRATLATALQLSPSGPDRPVALRLLPPLAMLLIDDPDAAPLAHKCLREASLGDTALAAAYLDTCCESNTSSEHADAFLEYILSEGAASLLLSLPSNVSSERWRRAAALTRWIDGFRRETSYQPGMPIGPAEIRILIEGCTEPRSPEQADMLALILGQLRSSAADSLTLARVQIEALVLAGRFDLALALARLSPQLRFGQGQVSPEEYVARTRATIPARAGTPSGDYRRIAQQLLGRA